MKKIGIFYGSDTGNTEKIAYKIHKQLGKNNSKIFDISDSSLKKIKKFNILFFGIPTWYYGELQCDWPDSLSILKKIDLKNKIIALFGCGDQKDYSEYFCDSIGIMYDILKKKNAKLVGKWSTKNYKYEYSKAQKNKSYFFGLPIDEDNQSKLTNKRIKKWLQLVIQEINNILKNNFLHK
ncbi:flavodoxin FldA [Buchnera aphidicola]|uniref:Flavodoxin n=1 Tax=Buchnera aphidicola subsp. Cinara cedri (strain Cc) TaxID=372461 RepID=Q057P5_BUCCC|nr:flavodoxin FldA [Buchnera aphidicola]ABJ90654.1 flavodoxin 1 (Low-potential electron donor) [Buchnera aphidicola BCc]